ncbi:hypothetical protein ACNJX9_35800 [Bradyrhizobium sp. DASA03076]|uniref:hypothetical protein n=1 Tax=Bradyrhizobium sp. BLXBL-03 TaxID=3395916 RepID=UPI003F6FF34E
MDGIAKRRFLGFLSVFLESAFGSVIDALYRSLVRKSMQLKTLRARQLRIRRSIQSALRDKTRTSGRDGACYHAREGSLHSFRYIGDGL